MERETIIKTTLSGNPNSLHFKSFVPKNTQEDLSFSIYLKPKPKKMDLRDDIVGGTIDDCDQISVFEAENYFSESADQKEKRKTLLNMEDSATLENSIATSKLAYRVNSFHATPTASSEASWNSQTGLLTNSQGSIPLSLRSNSNDSRKTGSKMVKNWFLIRKCPCFGNKSVQVEGKIPNLVSSPSILETKKNPNSTSIPPIYDSRNFPNSTVFAPEKTPNSTSAPSIFDPKKNPTQGINTINASQTQSSESQRGSFTSNEKKPEVVFPNFRLFTTENQFPKATHLRSSANGNGFQFSFPILNSEIKNQPNPNSLEDKPRESLEVFQPALETDAGGRVRRNYPFPASPMARITSTEDDVASEESSDLFEIESLSINMNTNLIYTHRNSLDQVALFNRRGRASVYSVFATECYAPSEASVVWSVTTAEGIDRGSLANFSTSVSQVDFGIKYNGGGGGDGVTWNGLGLGCRGEKAVSLGPPVGKEGGAWSGGGSHGKVRHVGW